MVLEVVTTKVSVNKTTNLEEVIASADLPENTKFKADKDYHPKKNNEFLKKKKLKNYNLKKAKKKVPLTKWEKKFNKLKRKTRFKGRRTFG